jgi:uncharacterized protein YgbK (DUF1537 family)
MVIIADDLTGALDTSAPFVAVGQAVAVATRPEGVAAALAEGADVVVVNTASRALTADAASRVVRGAALALRAAQPRLVFKKIDSRLKGNVGAETAAIAEAFGLDAVVVAPAVPEQGRVTRNGAVAGRGVDSAAPIAPLFASQNARVADAESAADLDRVVAETDWSSTLAVGASGLGAAFARRQAATVSAPLPRSRRTLFVIGSRDAITGQQIAELVGVAIADAPQGSFGGAVTLPAVLRCTGPDTDAEAVARRFADSAAAIIADTSPDVVVMSGGDTALAVLDRLDVTLVRPRGEAAPGLPWFAVARSGVPRFTAVVKSGGFGDSRSLAALLPPPDA